MKTSTTKTDRKVALRKGDRITIGDKSLTVARIANVHVYFEETDRQGQRIIATREGLNERLLKGEATFSHTSDKAYRRDLKPIF